MPIITFLVSIAMSMAGKGQEVLIWMSKRQTAPTALDPVPSMNFAYRCRGAYTSAGSLRCRTGRGTLRRASRGS